MDPNDARCPTDIFGEHQHSNHNTEHARTVPQPVSRRPLPSETWVQSPASACGIYGGQTGNWTRFLPEYFYRLKYDATGAPRSFITDAT